MIAYHLPARAFVTLDIYTTTGEKLVTLVRESQESGMHRVFWDGKGAKGEPMPPGQYLYHIKLPTCTQVRLIPLVAEGGVTAPR